MPRTKLISENTLFEVEDILGRKIRTTKSYWKKIKEIKHPELKAGTDKVTIALINPDEIRRDISDPTILLYAQKQVGYATIGAKRELRTSFILIAAKILNGDGFLVTVYQTKKYKPKGELIWQKTTK